MKSCIQVASFTIYFLCSLSVVAGHNAVNWHDETMKVIVATIEDY